MFNPPHEEDSKFNIVNKNLPNKRLPKRKNKKRLKKDVKRHTKFSCSMSSWAENFTFAATWQLKQQVAFWKARAKALEYENNVLHDVIRRNQCVVTPDSCTEDINGTDNEINDSEQEERQTGNAVDEDYVEGDDNWVVTEEFITFLAENAEHKENIKRERELKVKLQQKNRDQDHIIEEMQETAEERMERMKSLYSDKWQRISALEMSLVSSFIQESDLYKPSYWPNIPFNFNDS